MSNVVEYILSLKDNLSSGLEKSDESAKHLESTMSNVSEVGKGLLETLGVAFGMYEAFEFLKDAGEDMQKVNEETAKLNANLIATGGASRENMSDLASMADELREKVTYSKSEILDMQSQLLTFPSITKDTFQESMGLVADLAAQTNRGLSDTAIMFGKAMNNPAEGLQALRRYGVMFTDSQKDMITHLVDSGHKIEAQKYMLEAIATSGYKGVAEAMAAQDPMHQTKVAMEEAKEAVGGLVLSLETKLAPTLKSIADGFKETIAWMREHKELLEFIASTIGIVVTAVVAYTTALKAYEIYQKSMLVMEALAIQYNFARAEGMGVLTSAQYALNIAMDANPIGIIIIALVALGTIIYEAFQHFKWAREVIMAIWEVLKAWGEFIIDTPIKILKALGEMIIGSLTMNPKKIAQGFEDAKSVVFDGAKNLAGAWNKGWDEGGKSFGDAHQKSATENAKDKNAQKQTALATAAKNGEGTTDSGKGTKASGTKNVSIKITINELVHNFSVLTTNVKEGAGAIKKMIEEALVAAVNDSQIVAGS